MRNELNNPKPLSSLHFVRFSEEVFSGRPTLWLSPDGKKLSYLRFDDTPVRRINIPIYGIAGAPDFQYPADLPVNYPKVQNILLNCDLN